MTPALRLVARAAVRAQRPTIARSMHASTSLRKDPFPLPFDPALAAARAEAMAQRDPEDVLDGWAMPPPLDRTGETPEVLRARLVYQTRKRGTLENDLLFSTFARDHLAAMSVVEMQEFDKLLDEPDWDVYYWCTDKKPAPEKWANTELLARLKKHVKNENKEHRFMPDILDVQK